MSDYPDQMMEEDEMAMDEGMMNDGTDDGMDSDPTPAPPMPIPINGCTQSQVEANKNISAAVSAVLFGALSAPVTYRMSNQIFTPLGLEIADRQGCPNVAGLIVHGLIYTGLTRLLMDQLPKCDYKKPYNNQDKWVTSAMGGALFILVSSPFAYQITNSLVTSVAGDQSAIATSEGCPEMSGLLIHTLIFGGVVRLLMRN